jgi:hypothetical protein
MSQNRPSFPTGDDLREWMVSNRLIESSYAGDLQSPIDSTIVRLQNDTGYTPFLGSAVASARRFNAPGPRLPRHRTYLDLLGGAGSDTGGGTGLDLGAGIVGSPVSMTVDGVALVEDEDYYLLPENSDAEGKPWTMLKFTRPVWSKPRGIVVTARWGYCLAPPDGVGIPGDIWLALLQGAASSIFYALPNVADLESVSRNGISESFEIASTVTANQRGEALEKEYLRLIKDYRRAGD